MDKPDPADDERESTPDSDFASIVKTKPDKRKRAADGKADESDRKKSYRRSWRSASPLTKLMIYFTGITALATLLYMSFTGWQLYEIRSGSEETRKLAQAAQDGADAAQKQAALAIEQLEAVKEATGAARDSADTAHKQANVSERLAEQNERLVEAARAQASAAEKSGQIATRALLIGSQAYLDVALDPPKISPNEETEFSITIVNEGNSPATLDLRWGLRFTEKLEMPIFDYSGVGAYIPHTFILPKNNRQLVLIGRALTPDEVSKISNDKLYIFLSGRGEFLTVGQRRSLTFCYIYYGKPKFWSDCTELIQGVKENKTDPNLIERFRTPLNPLPTPSPTPKPN